MSDLIGKLRRGLKKPPRVIADRLLQMSRAQLERFRWPMRQRLSLSALLGELGARDLDDLWSALAQRPYPARVEAVSAERLDALCPGESARLLERAEAALRHEVDLLGSGPTALGETIDWHTDFKTGLGWAPRYCQDIDYNNPDRPSDVKMPWELSRLQWLVPAGQAYLLTSDERYARGVRDVLEQWIAANPCAWSVNWSCTMEPALRIFTWTWFFRVFHASVAWADRGFRERFLRALYLHVEFTERHIERSDINGNHYTADAAGLVVGGLFFGQGRLPERWARGGWAILLGEIGLQVFPDGVDFEASVPYHRLVAELFLWPAMYRQALGLDIDPAYRERLLAMGRFTAAYSKPDGQAPLWGDADDARALPFGTQSINDHRYLVAMIGHAMQDATLAAGVGGPVAELIWTVGADVVSLAATEPPALGSAAFPQGGFYAMRSGADHVFIDAGPLGLAGRGGHGHNDCLAFEAVLDGVPLVSDCGAYLYTASYEERNRFRSTAYHNTPQVDGEEINRFIRPDYLWNLHNDAVPSVRLWQDDTRHALLIAEHSGYRRLADPITVRRAFLLDKRAHALLLVDRLEGMSAHSLEIPLHLCPGIEVERIAEHALRLTAQGRHFLLEWRGDAAFEFQQTPARVSPSYGQSLVCTRLAWRARLNLPQTFSLAITPEGGMSLNLLAAALTEREPTW
ncbi:alginate lyase family protein [uncultured Hydrogenophaga sp.]|jgi:uncharacterized heparinase superfamily protein|uniref:alginate lyase family protein n=1 Tax=uncultured Hydrogenophaga sp. TaxID=199683 RepID=UPI00258BEB52|nr:alginate lyase family protein [uncultured Hydrogenophaga sp.]